MLEQVWVSFPLNTSTLKEHKKKYLFRGLRLIYHIKILMTFFVIWQYFWNSTWKREHKDVCVLKWSGYYWKYWIKMYILASDLFRKCDNYVFQARNSCCGKEIISLVIPMYLSSFLKKKKIIIICISEILKLAFNLIFFLYTISIWIYVGR